MIDIIIKYSQGNPGAMSVLMKLLQTDNEKHKTIMSKIQDCDLKGFQIYVLYSDLGYKNIDTVYTICKTVPNNVLIDACNKQDYSGRELIKPYMNIDLNMCIYNLPITFTISGELPCTGFEDFMSEQRVHFTIITKDEFDSENEECSNGEEFENGRWYDIVVDENFITEESAKKVIAEKLGCNISDVIIIQKKEIRTMSNDEFTQIVSNSQFANSDIFKDGKLDIAKLLKLVTNELIEKNEEYENYEECQRLKDIQDSV